MVERRSLLRKRAFLKGVICFNKRSSTMECTIRDISEGGARLVVSSAVTVPEAFELFIPSKNEYLDAKQRWRRGDDLGIEFVREKEASAVNGIASGDLASRVLRLEKQVETLERSFGKLRSSLNRPKPDRDSE